MPSFLSSKKCTFIKTSKKAKAAAVGDKKRPASASSLKSETHSNSSTATVRPIQVQESEDGSLAKDKSQQDEVTVIEETLKECIDDYNKARGKEEYSVTENMKMSKSKSDTGFNHMVSPVQHVQRTESYGDIKSLHVVKANPSPRNTLEVTSQSRGERSLTMSRNRREATYCKYLLRNAAHRRSQSRLSQKLNKLDSMGSVTSNEALRQIYSREDSTPSELTSVTSLSSFGSVSSFHSANSLASNNTGADMQGNLARVLAKENKTKMSALLVLARRRQLARDDLSKFSMSDIAVCGSRIDRAYVQQQEELHYLGVIYPIKIVSTDDLMFPNRKFSLQVGSMLVLMLRAC